MMTTAPNCFLLLFNNPQQTLDVQLRDQATRVVNYGQKERIKYGYQVVLTTTRTSMCMCMYMFMSKFEAPVEVVISDNK